MRPVRFADTEHETFFVSMMKRAGVYDSYHKALFYTLGICPDTREHMGDLFDFKEQLIKPEGLSKGWQTGGSRRVTRLAFNLWNGWREEGAEGFSTPYELFDCDFAPYFLEAIRIKYPDYCREIREGSREKQR